MSIQTEFDRMTLAKDDIKEALEFQNQSVSSSDKIDDLSEKIANIPTIEIPYVFDFTDGWCDGSTGWTYEVKNPPTNYSDIYKIKGGHSYAIHLGATVGNRFRSCDVASDPTELASGSLPKVSFAYRKDNPPAYSFIDITYNYPGTTPSGKTQNVHSGAFYANADGYLVIQKSNNSVSNLKTYVWDLGTPVEVDLLLDETLFNISNGSITLKSSVDKSTIKGSRIVPNTVEGQTVTGLGNDCFKDCVSLSYIKIPNTVTSIGNYALAHTQLKEFDIPSNVTSIGNYAFYDNDHLTEMTIPSTVTSLGTHTFESCGSLTTCTIQSPVTTLTGTFNGCNNLTSVTVPSTVTHVTDYAFYNCKGLTAIPSMPNLTDIGTRSFSECDNIRGQLVLQNTITTISSYAFRGCSHLTSVIIPSSVTTINGSAFSLLENVTYFELQGTTPPHLANSNAFSDTNNCPIYVPDAAVTDYQSASQWSNLATRITGVSNKPA